MADLNVSKEDLAYLRIAQLEAALKLLASPIPLNHAADGAEVDLKGEMADRERLASAALEGDLAPLHRAAMFRQLEASDDIEPYVWRVESSLEKLKDLDLREDWMALQHGIARRETGTPVRTKAYIKEAQTELLPPPQAQKSSPLRDWHSTGLLIMEPQMPADPDPVSGDLEF